MERGGEPGDRTLKYRRLLLFATWLLSRGAMVVSLPLSHDVQRYFDVADAWMRGGLADAGHPLEYPPAALLVFVIPRLFCHSVNTYRLVFAAQMLSLDLLLVWLLSRISRSLIAQPSTPSVADERDAWREPFPTRVALFYLLLSAPLYQLLVTRFDLVPTVLLIAWTACTIAGRRRWLSDLLLAAAVSVRLFPLLLVPLYLGYLSAEERERRLRPSVMRIGAGVALFHAPFLWLGGRSLLGFICHYGDRGLQIESSYSSLIILGKHIFRYPLDHQIIGGATYLTGNAALPLVAHLSLVIVLVAVAVVSVSYIARMRRERDREQRKWIFIRAVLACLMAMVLGSSALNPEYLIGVTPFIALVTAEGGVRPAAILRWAFVAFVLFFVYFTFYFGELQNLELVPAIFLLARNAALFALTMQLWSIDAEAAAAHPLAAALPPSAWKSRVGLMLPQIALALCLVWITLATFTRVGENDIFIQMRVAKDILAQRAIPTTDIYSASAAGRLFIAHEWLSGMVFLVLSQLHHGLGLTLLQVAIGLSCALLMYFSIPRQERTRPMTIPLLALCLYAMLVRIAVRPHLFTCFFLTALIWGLEHWRRSRDVRYLVWLPFAQVIWVNLHGEAPVGPAILTLVTLVAASTLRWPSWRPTGEPPFTHRDLKHLIIVTAICWLALLVNPYGPKLFAYSFRIATTGAYYKPFINEWLPIFGHHYGHLYVLWAYSAVLALLWILLLTDLRRRPLLEIALALFATCLSLSSRRFVVYVPIIGFPIISRLLSQALRRFTAVATLHRPLAAVALMAGLVMSTLAYGYGVSDDQHSVLGWGFGGEIPYAEVRFIKQAGLKGVIFNEYTDGALIIAELFPDARPVMDSRVDIYGAELFNEWRNSCASRSSFDAYLKKYQVSMILIEKSLPPPKLAALIDAERWQLVMESEHRRLYVRRDVLQAPPQDLLYQAAAP
jgi:hypothetical protein